MRPDAAIEDEGPTSCDIATTLRRLGESNAQTSWRRWRVPVRIGLIYLSISVMWIFVSDTLLGLLVKERELLIELSLIKGWAFMFVTAVLLAFIVERHLCRVMEAQEGLRRSEERYHVVALATSDAIWDWNLRTDELAWNEGARSLFATPKELRQGHVSWWYDHIHPDDKARVVDGIHDAIRAGRSEWTDEYRYRRADGDYAIVLDRGFVIHDGKGEPVRMIGGMSDVTELRRSQNALRERLELVRLLYQELDHRVRNNLASLLALINLSKRSSDDLNAYIASVEGRVRTMAAVHSLLSQTQWQPVELTAIANVMLPQDVEAVVTLQGPPVRVPAHQVTATSMVLHELYAESRDRATSNGRTVEISVKWTAVEQPTLTLVVLTWSDRSGPTTNSEQMRVCDQMVTGLTRADLNGRADLSINEDGARHQLTLQLDMAAQPHISRIDVS